MFEDADNFADIFRGGLPFYVLITIPILLICSSNPVLASSEFNVQRMTQYDLHGNPLGKLCLKFRFSVKNLGNLPNQSVSRTNENLGCRASALNLEAKSLQTWSTPRHCIFTRFVRNIRRYRHYAHGRLTFFHLVAFQISRFNCGTVSRNTVESWWPSYSAAGVPIKTIGRTTSGKPTKQSVICIKLNLIGFIQMTL